MSAAWHPDPTGRHELRYWDGTQWTDHVSDHGVQSQSPLYPQAEQHAEQSAEHVDDGSGWIGSEVAASDGESAHDADAAALAAAEADPETAARSENMLAEGGTGQLAPEPADTTADTAADETVMAQPSDGASYAQAAPTGPPPATPPAWQPQQWQPGQGAAQQYAAQPGQQQYAAQPGAQPYGDAFSGISGELIDGRFSEIAGAGAILQSKRMLRVRITEPFMAVQGSMVAYQGNVNFIYQGSGAAKFLKKALTGEGLSLMRVEGQGDVFLADNAAEVHILHLTNSGLSVSSSNVLAFSASLQWNVERVKGGSIAAGGLFNTTLRGTGWVAITTDGDPVVLNAGEAPTFADANALVAWSVNLETSLRSTMTAGALIGRGSGEAFQVAFRGPGFVIVQPSEGFHSGSAV